MILAISHANRKTCSNVPLHRHRDGGDPVTLIAFSWSFEVHPNTGVTFDSKIKALFFRTWFGIVDRAPEGQSQVGKKKLKKKMITEVSKLNELTL